MNSREEFDELMMLLRFMSGEKNVIEHVEAEGQQKIINMVTLPKEMTPDREEWERLGFTFCDIPGDDVLWQATLPEGWSIKATSHSMWSDIIDNKGRKRGSIFYKASFYDRKGSMRLRPRYEIKRVYSDDTESLSEVYFGSEEEKIFVAGQIDESVSYADQLEQSMRLHEIAFAYAKEHYPEWQSATAYWDDEIEKVKVPKKKKNN